MAAGIVAGVSRGLYQYLSTPTLDWSSFINDFLWNPLSSSAVAAWLAGIAAIGTLVIYQVATGASLSADDSHAVPEERANSTGPEHGPKLSEEEKRQLDSQRQLDRIRFAFTRNRRRMTDEIARVQRNAFLNLSIGILFSLVALGILGYPLVVNNESGVPLGWLGFAEHFAPRFSVGVLVQLIGFFFLRLYVSSEREIHYIRNEITNIESRMIAYHIAAVGKDQTALRDVTKQLVRTERNFRLRKGEHSLYEVDTSYNDVGELLGRLAGSFGKVSSKKRV